MKLVCMSMIFHCTRLHLSKCRVSRVVSIKQNDNGNFKQPAMLVILVFRKRGHLKFVNSLKLYQHTKCHCPTLAVPCFASASEIWRPPFCNGWSYSIKNDGIEVTFNVMIFLLNFVKIYQLDQKFLRRPHIDARTHRLKGDLISMFFFLI
jgi:hypothetical protein